MGIALSGLFNPVEINIESLSGRKIAIDGNNALYQFASTIRQYDGSFLMDSKGRVTSHLSGLFYRTMSLLKHGVKPCFVFDGKPPSFKNATIGERVNAREKAREEYKLALEEEDFERAKSKAQQSTRITPEMFDESRALLDYMGVPVINAPSEGEAQASHMCFKGDVFACVSQDYDSLLFNSPILIRNLNITGKRKLPQKNIYVNITPEKIVLQDELNRLGLFHDQLIMMGILVGTDFNPKGIFGIGPKKAYDLVKQYPNFDTLFNNVKWTFDISPKEIFDFFKNPPVTNDYNLHWKQPNPDKIFELLCDEHNFSKDRVENTLGKLSQLRKKEGQTGLDKFF
ncbi:Flap endonuclease 1 [Candidatus Tiddalikarchaeum anstoanum]|nr:Flap endonuclease 1 [Candidatus Tiddalikarchaeum anstoanum]